MSHSNRSAFSLIELLVVISIVALLVAILLPALGEARLVAQATLCPSQMKQIGYAYEYYANDYDDYIPNSRYASDGWQSKLGSMGVFGMAKTEQVIHWDFSSVWNRGVYSLLKCPTDRDVYFGTGGAANGRSFPRWAMSYTLSSYDQNWSISRHAYTVPRKGWTLGYDNNNISPDQAALQMDSMAQTSQAWFQNATDTAINAPGSTISTVRQIGFRHPGEVANVVFWDLHLEPQRHFFETGEKIYKGHLYSSNPG